MPRGFDGSSFGGRWPCLTAPASGTYGSSKPAVDAAEHQSAAAHVAAADEVGREHQALAEDRQQQVDVFAGRDAAEQHDLAVGTNRLAQRLALTVRAARGTPALRRSISPTANARNDSIVTGVSAARRPAFDVMTSTPPAGDRLGRVRRARETGARRPACRGSTNR